MGGTLFVIGALIMAYNLWMTVRHGEAESGWRSSRPSEGKRHVALDQAASPQRRRLDPVIMAVLLVMAIVEIAPLFYLKSTSRRCRACAPTPRGTRAATSTSARAVACHSRIVARCATRSSATATTHSRGRACTTTPQWGSKRTGPDLAPGRRQIFRRMARHPSQQSTRNRSRNPRLLVPWPRTKSSIMRTSPIT